LDIFSRLHVCQNGVTTPHCWRSIAITLRTPFRPMPRRLTWVRSRFGLRQD